MWGEGLRLKTLNREPEGSREKTGEDNGLNKLMFFYKAPRRHQEAYKLLSIFFVRSFINFC